jgi:tRNA (cytidine/uridine-2'-O-)-methyltransferase
MTTPPSARGFTGDVNVVLVAPEIHWNTGNVGRTCLALGARLHLVEPLGFSLDEREVRRAGLDYWDKVQPTVWPSFAALERELPTLGEAFLFSAEAERSYWDVRYPRPVTLLFGSESSGLPPEVRDRRRDRLVRLPMDRSGVRSLNLSTAVAVALFEVFRQRA